MKPETNKKMNKQKLNLLILEDNPDDAELIIKELKKEGFVLEWKRVETEKAFKKALAEKPDIILSDYNLPSFNGMAAIKLQQQTAPDIPLIIMSGTIGEDIAVECVKAGATDYVLKDKISRLGTVIKRAIKEAEELRKRKQAEKKLQKYVKEQKVLLKEVNHRVKNNLAAIIGFLYLKEAKTKNKEILTFINELIIRINGLSTVHSMLSESNWRPLNLNKLCDNIINASLIGLPNSNMIDIYVSPSLIQISSNQAHSLTLVMNELITNSMKYGQNSNNKINLNVDIKKNKKNIIITYRDNGQGYPQSLTDGDFSDIGIGFELIKGIVTQSLKGDMQIFNDNGAATVIKFKPET